MAQFSRPIGDISASAWLPSTGSTLYTMIDETTSSTSDYIMGMSSDICILDLNGFTDPGIYTGWSLRITYRLNSSFMGKQTLDITVQGLSADLAVVSFADQPDNTWHTNTFGLSAVQAQLIAQDSDLSLKIRNNTSANADVAWFEIEGPDAAGSAIDNINGTDWANIDEINTTPKANITWYNGTTI